MDIVDIGCTQGLCVRLNWCVSRVCPMVSGFVVVRIAAWEIASVQACFMDRQLGSVADLGVARKTFEFKVAQLGVMRAFVLPMFDRIAGNHVLFLFTFS